MSAKTYRHFNFLIDGELYTRIRKYGQKQELPLSAIVRAAVVEFLDTRQCRQIPQV